MSSLALDLIHRGISHLKPMLGQSKSKVAILGAPYCPLQWPPYDGPICKYYCAFVPYILPPMLKVAMTTATYICEGSNEGSNDYSSFKVMKIFCLSW